MLVVTRRYSAEQLSFAVIRQKIASTTENAVLRASNGPDRRDRSVGGGYARGLDPGHGHIE
jgi:hypothetical protein